MSCTVGYRLSANSTRDYDLVASITHLILIARAECLARRQSMARVAVLRLNPSAELLDGRLEDASDRTTGESIKSAVCNTEVTEEATFYLR